MGFKNYDVVVAFHTISVSSILTEVLLESVAHDVLSRGNKDVSVLTIHGGELEGGTI